MIFNLVPHTDIALKQVLPKFDFSDPPINPLDFACDLAETMLHHNGIGLAANQCGFDHRVFTLLADEIIVCYNPRIVDMSLERIYLEEVCLSYPGLVIKVKRSKRIKVRFDEPNGNTVTKVYDGLTSRAFQHHIDILNGVCHIDLANGIHREQAFKNWKRS